MTLELTDERRRGTDRRSRTVSFRYPERRTGFARRRPEVGGPRRAYLRMLDGYRARPEMVAVVLATFVALNLADLMLTLRALRLGAAEANPAMALLFGMDPAAATVFKLAVGVGVALVVWSLRRYRLMLETSLLLVAGFAVLMLYHLAGEFLLAG